MIPNRALLKGKRVIFCDDSIVRGTQLRDNVNILYGYGAKEVHMRIGCPPILHACPFVGFSASKSHLELIARRIVKELEGDDAKDLDKYATTGTEQYNMLVERIREQLNITTLKFNTVEDLIASMGTVWDQFHFSNQVTYGLVGRGKATGPCRCIFNDSTTVRNPFTFSISQRHTNTGVRDTRYKISIHLILLRHSQTAGIAGSIYVHPFIFRDRITIVHP